MKLFHLISIALITFSCGTQKNMADFKTFLYQDSQNSFHKQKILPGRPEAKPYTQYTVIINPTRNITDLKLYTEDNKEIEYREAVIMDDVSQLELYFTNRNQIFDENKLYFTYNKDNETIMVKLPKPQDKGTIAMP